MVWQIICVASGGAIGAVLRHMSMVTAMKWLGISFPFGTMVVNIAGSFAMGVVISWLSRTGLEEAFQWRLFLASGILGGFTTFSAFSYDIVQLWQRGESHAAAIYCLITVVTSVLALLAGLMLVKVDV